ncbi:MAG: hypothetical protein KDD44_00560 [Bdellovibrionales bacterium]|nr:hypothetical protein [Bdellovibrionales bacterium]
MAQKHSDMNASTPAHEPEYVEERIIPEEDITEIPGTAGNISKAGSPIDRMDHAPIRYYFYPTWRSQLLPLIGFFITAALAIWISRKWEITVIAGELISIGDTTYYLHLPILALVPGFLLGKILIYIYDSKYIIDERGVEAQVGLVSLSLRQPRLRYEDIRGVEPNQTILERLLGIGSVLIGSAMTQDVEIVMEGVANPRAIQLLLQGERDKKLRMLSNTGIQQQSMGLTGD